MNEQSTTTTDMFRREAEELSEALVKWRRDFHMYPELGFEEVRTAGIVAEHLQNLGLEVATGLGKTGVAAVIEGDDVPADAPTVLLRFDMDALPIEEDNEIPYRSQIPGVMHACGHDGHTAIGMGVAEVLVRHRERLAGRVKLAFQPAEEGLGGALAMIEDGVMAEPVPTASFGLHLWSRLPLNQVVVQPGPLWASAGFFKLTIRGRGGHGAVPQETIDATMVASHIVVAWQSIVARSIAPSDTGVVTVGTFHSGDLYNVIADEAILTGTIRSYDADVHSEIQNRMQTIAAGICQAFGATFDLEFLADTPATINSEEGAMLMKSVAESLVGVDLVTQIKPMMVGEDMSEFLNRAPGCFVLIGASDPETGWHSPHHNSTFDFDERMLTTGVALLASAAVAYLDRPF